MTSQLIINADDFGLTPGINQAIVELYRAGALSSATLMANGGAFVGAVDLAHQLPGLGIGCHIVLIDGMPVANTAHIPTLLGADKRSFRPSMNSFARAVLLGRLKESEIEREATSQITRLIDAGIQPTHLDTHKHTHMFPSILRPLLRVAERLGIPSIRNPFEPAWNLRLGRGGIVRRLQMRVLGRMEHSFHAQPAIREGRVRTTQGAAGISATGSLDSAALRALLAAMPAGTFELVCHPGYPDTALKGIRTRLRGQREVERDALLSVIPEALRSSPARSLISFAALAADGPPNTI